MEKYDARIIGTSGEVYLELFVDKKPIGTMPVKYQTGSHEVLSHLNSLGLSDEEKRGLGKIAIELLVKQKNEATERIMSALNLEGKLEK